jgi:Inner membrane component of T3SS, cytoplasmic domain
MIWVEILSRHRDVAARFRISGSEAYIGRGYDNDVIVDDPYVAARHLRVFRDTAGRLVAEDAGSKNGLFLDRDGARRDRIVLDPEHPIRIGHTVVRIRDEAHAVPLERLTAARRTPVWSIAIAVALGVAILGIEALSVWLAQIGEPRTPMYLNPLITVSEWVLVWVAAWTIVCRLFFGQAHLLQNLLIALAGLLVFSLYREFAQFAAFAFTWPVAMNYEYAVQSFLIAAVCFFHLRETGRSHLALKGAVVVTLLAVAVAVQTVQRLEAVSDFGPQNTARRLLPPALRLAPVRDEADFFAEIERLKAGLDRDRTPARGE